MMYGVQEEHLYMKWMRFRVRTNEESEESVEHLCAKCDDYAKEWAPVADDIWAGQKHYKKAYENYAKKDEKPLNIVAFKHKPRQHHFKHKRA